MTDSQNRMPPARPTALVTGGSGLLGRHLVRKLLDRGAYVRIFDLVPPESVAGVEYLQGNITDADAVMDACEGCSSVFHLAGRMPQARLGTAGFARVNVDGTRNVAEGCVRQQVPVLVFASSIEVYGPRKDFPIAEDADKFFTGIYSRTKFECERMLMDFRQTHGLRVSMMRMPLILGPGFYHERSVLTMMKRVRSGKFLPLPGGPEIPFIAVAASDAADAMIAAADCAAADGQAFNIAAARAEPVRQLFTRFIGEVGSDSRVIGVPPWIMSAFVWFMVKFEFSFPGTETPPELLPFTLTGGDYSIAKARKVLGYAPKKDCLSALVETYQWYVQENPGC